MKTATRFQPYDCKHRAVAPPCSPETDLWKLGVDLARPRLECLVLMDDSLMPRFESEVLDKPSNAFSMAMKLPASEFSLVVWSTPIAESPMSKTSVCFVKEGGYNMKAYEFLPRYDPLKTMPPGSTGMGLFYRTADGVLRFGIYDVWILGERTTIVEGHEIPVYRMDCGTGVSAFERVAAMTQAERKDESGLVHVRYSGWAECYLEVLRRHNKPERATFAVLGATPHSPMGRFFANL